MGFFDRFKNVSLRAGNAAHQGLAKVRHGLEDAEGRLRQRMRIYPKRPKFSVTKSGAMAEPFHSDDQLLVVMASEEPVRLNQPQPHEAIVLVNGRDVDAKELDAA